MTSTGSALDIVLRGTDGTEAEEFIAAIEELAFTEGWSRDRERMLLFARSRLRHKALRWFARLDPSKKDDWDLFVEALFDQYTLVEAPTKGEISTPVWSATTFSPGVPAAILPSDHLLDLHPNVSTERQPVIGCNIHHFSLPSSKAYDPSIPGRRFGILRIAVEDGTTCPQYIWNGGSYKATSSEVLRTTMNRQDALIVSFTPAPGTHSIGCLNASSGRPDLSVYYPGSNGCDLRVAYGQMDIYQTIRDCVSNIWNVLSDGSLEATLPEFKVASEDSYGNYTYSRTDYKTAEVLLDASGTSFRFVKPGTLPRQDDPKLNTQPGRYEFKARIVFEPF